MPLPRPCAGCGVIVRSSRCAACRSLKEKMRPTRAQRGYDYEWAKLSKQMRELQPWCSRCLRTEDLTLDHITPLSAGGRSVYSNVQVLCRRCNSEKGQE